MKSRFFLFRWIGSLINFFLSPFKKLIILLAKPLKKIILISIDKTKKNIRLELMVTFGVCLFAAFIIFGISNRSLKNTSYSRYIDYEQGKSDIARQAQSLVEEINRNEYKIEDTKSINELINRRYSNSENKIIITDLEGKVLFKSQNVSETQIDIYSLIKSVMEVKQINYYNGNSKNWHINSSGERKEYISFYPVSFQDIKSYLIVRGIPQGIIIEDPIQSKDSFTALLIAVAAFIIFFIIITNKKMRYIEEISSGLMEISRGDLKYRVDRKGEDELSGLADNINHMAEEIESMIEKDRRMERTKNELITNVSHDLRTPLTSVMGYLGLIKEGKYESDMQMKEYLEIASSKAEKLKILIEDLFEYTKLTNEGIKLHTQDININELLVQLLEELIPIFDENNLTVNKQIITEKLLVRVDSDKMVRVLENLIINAVKYSYKPGEIGIMLYKENEKAVICIRNKGQNIPKEELPRLFERFYRLDKARTTTSGGSGLGLAIAKSIIELHGGDIWVDCENEDIKFYISLKLV